MESEEGERRELALPFASALLYAFLGGYGDAAGLLRAGVFTGHVTGNVVLLAMAIGAGGHSELLSTILAIVLFCVSTVAGKVLGVRCGPFAFEVLSVVQCLLLATAAVAASHADRAGLIFLVSFSSALGLQNGVVQRETGGPVHTTYVTGAITSVLLHIGSGDSREKTARSHNALIAIAFFFGALVAGGINKFSPHWLFVASLPMVLAAGIVAGWGIRRQSPSR